MGVSGSGKTTVGAALAEELGAGFVDGDDLHAGAALAKMSAGLPLTDADREPWLRRVGETLRDASTAGSSIVIACSALRRRYRDTIRSTGGEPVYFIHLVADEAVLRDRVTTRADHFMPPALLTSQLATLEPLELDEEGGTYDATASWNRIAEQLGIPSPSGRHTKDSP
ncbi:gluconokinase [Microbacterium deminutum]